MCPHLMNPFKHHIHNDQLKSVGMKKITNIRTALIKNVNSFYIIYYKKKTEALCKDLFSVYIYLRSKLTLIRN